MKALVTGATGFIGSHLCERLLAEGWRVMGCDVRPSSLLQGIDYYVGPMESLTRSALDGVTHVFHLAGLAGVRDSWGAGFEAYVQRNVIATQALLETCTRLPHLQRFVFASTSAVANGHPVSPYGISKLAAEHVCRVYAEQCNVPVVTVRYFTVYGPRQRPDMAFHRWIRAVLDGRPIVLYGDGSHARDFTFVDDIVAGTIAAGHGGVVGRTYDLGRGESVLVREAIAALGRAVGAAVEIDVQPQPIGEMRATRSDIAPAARDFRYAPTVSLDEGLRRQVAWQRASMLAPVMEGA